MKHRLTVEIEKRFKRQLSKRFNPKNVVDVWFDTKGINIKCSLCDEYWRFDGNKDFCKRCPFYVYHNTVSKGNGCVKWISRVMGKKWREIFVMGSECIEWNKEDNKKAIELLKKLREKAKKYIIWI